MENKSIPTEFEWDGKAGETWLEQRPDSVETPMPPSALHRRSTRPDGNQRSAHRDPNHRGNDQWQPAVPKTPSERQVQQVRGETARGFFDAARESGQELTGDRLVPAARRSEVNRRKLGPTEHGPTVWSSVTSSAETRGERGKTQDTQTCKVNSGPVMLFYIRQGFC